MMDKHEHIEMKDLTKKLRSSDAQSIETDYADNPHVYNNKWQYIMSAIGVCVGFGAFWRFPYLVYKNGGGTFLVPYAIAMILIGMPLLYLETSIGQMHRVSIPFAFKRIHPSLKILGLALMTAVFHFSSVYNILLVYCYKYIFISFTSPLPFADQKVTNNGFFQDQVLNRSKSIGQFEAIEPSLILIYIGSMIFCYFVIRKGAKTSGKIIIFTASAPFIILFMMVVRGLFLQGALDGIIFLFKPKWEMLWDYTIWIDATTQVFYQLSLGNGCIINIATAKARREDLMKSIVLVPLGLVLCGLLSALTIFIYLSHFCLQSGYSIDDPALKLSGLQLSFNVLPKALIMLPLPNLMLFIFFSAMILLGIDSEFGLMQAVYCYVRDQFTGKQKKVCGITINLERAKIVTLMLMCAASPFLCSHAGIYYLGFFDYFMSNIPFTVWILMEIYFFVHVFPFSEMAETIHHYTKVRTPKVIHYCLTSYWLPGLLFINLILSTYNQIQAFRKYSLSFYLLGWLFTLYPMIMIWWRLGYHRQWPGWDRLITSFSSLDKRKSISHPL